MAAQIRVRIMTLAAGPAGVWQPGSEPYLDAEVAEGLIAAGFAQRVEQETTGAVAETVTVAPAEEAGGGDDWTSTAEEAKAEPEPAVTETATGGPQRSSEADDALAAERAGREAARAGKPRSDNPHDRRTSLGRAWDRGWGAGKG